MGARYCLSPVLKPDLNTTMQEPELLRTRGGKLGNMVFYNDPCLERDPVFCERQSEWGGQTVVDNTLVQNFIECVGNSFITPKDFRFNLLMIIIMCAF